MLPFYGSINSGVNDGDRINILESEEEEAEGPTNPQSSPSMETFNFICDEISSNTTFISGQTSELRKRLGRIENSNEIIEGAALMMESIGNIQKEGNVVVNKTIPLFKRLKNHRVIAGPDGVPQNWTERQKDQRANFRVGIEEYCEIQANIVFAVKKKFIKSTSSDDWKTTEALHSTNSSAEVIKIIRQIEQKILSVEAIMTKIGVVRETLDVESTEIKQFIPPISCTNLTGVILLAVLLLIPVVIILILKRIGKN